LKLSDQAGLQAFLLIIRFQWTCSNFLIDKGIPHLTISISIQLFISLQKTNNLAAQYDTILKQAYCNESSYIFYD